jgi:hypothetical protein
MREGDRVAGFVIGSATELPEYRARLVRARHEATGLEAVKIDADDEENLFAFAFSTPARDSTGVAHIVEHAVLAGSEAYPLRDAFMAMSGGSLSTFLNAFTFPDKTVYPGASVVEADYYNLMEVYGDAVFFPLLTRDTFMQEGLRLEPSGDAHVIQGVVYNEMKGANASPEGVASEWAIRALFDEGPYAHDWGGDPAFIPSLSYEAFKAFYAEHYHPSNCKLFLYGSFPLEPQLKFLERRFLSRFSLAPPSPKGRRASAVAPARRFKAPRRVEKACASSDEGGGIALVSFLGPEAVDAEATLSMELLSQALLGHDGAPLARALRESGLGKDLAGQCGIETEVAELIFTAGLRGVKPENGPRAAAFVVEALEKIASEGIPPSELEAAIRTFEFSAREVKRGSSPYGLRLMRKCLRGWLHGADPAESLAFEAPLAAVKARLARDKRYFEGLIERWLVGNPHRAEVIVMPDASKARADEEAEDSEAKRLALSLGEEALRALPAEIARLKAAQEAPEDPALVARLPRVSLRDIPRAVDMIEREVDEAGGVPYYRNPLWTNGVAYVDIAFDAEGIPSELAAWLPLYAEASVGMGLPGMGYREASLKTQSITGGINAYFSSNSPLGSPLSGGARSFVFFRMKCLESLLPEALDLFLAFASRADYGDERRLADILAQHEAEYRAALIPSGSAFASTRASRGLSDALALDEASGGIAQLLFAREALGRGPATAAEAFEAIRRSLLSARPLFHATGSKAALDAIGRRLEGFARSELAPLGPAPRALCAALPSVPSGERFDIPSQVGYAALALPAPRLDDPCFAAAQALGQSLSSGALWREIRMKGGAYGAGLAIDGIEGAACFTSYRDPDPFASLGRFKEALRRAAVEALGAEELERCIIGTVARELKPLAPEEKGFVDFRRTLYSISDELRQAKREALLALRASDIVDAAARLDSRVGEAVAVVIGPERLDSAEDFTRMRLAL